jgi:type IX secretion system PorP/SprF family membrane protein
MNTKQYTFWLALLFIATSLRLEAQQEARISQFMFNQLYFNPAYAGAAEKPCVSGLYRQQWLGLEGAPETQLVSFHTPLFQQRVGLGVNLSRQAIGVTRQVTAEMAYAYRIPMGQGYLSAGLSGSVRYFSEDYSDPRIRATQDISLDPGVPVGLQSRYIPNVGAGVYYYTRNWYAGMGVPRLIEAGIDFGNGQTLQSTERRHLYAMGGYRTAINELFSLHPQALLRYVEGAPFDAEISMLLEMNQQFHAGLSYRIGGHMARGSGESVNLLLGFYIQQRLLVAAAYDVTLTRIRTYQNGSVELLLQYCLGRQSVKTIDNPRFFE